MRISDWSSDVCSSDLHVLRDARTSRFLAIATLNIGAETAGTQGDWLARFRIGAKLDRPGVGDAAVLSAAGLRSEERRVGKECGSPCRSRWLPDHSQNKMKQ